VISSLTKLSLIALAAGSALLSMGASAKPPEDGASCASKVVPVAVAPPQYPSGSKMRHEEGEVVLAVTLNAAGEAIGARIAKSSGYEALDQSALRTSKVWRYDVAACLAEGSGSTVTIFVPTAFALKAGKVSSVTSQAADRWGDAR